MPGLICSKRLPSATSPHPLTLAIVQLRRAASTNSTSVLSMLFGLPSGSSKAHRMSSSTRGRVARVICHAPSWSSGSDTYRKWTAPTASIAVRSASAAGDTLSRSAWVQSQNSPRKVCEREWGVHGQPWVPRIVWSLEREDNVHGSRQVMADDQSFIAACQRSSHQ